MRYVKQEGSESFVSPWMKNGNALVYCKKNPSVERTPMAANVVISGEGVPLLCNFGLAAGCDGDEREAVMSTKDNEICEQVVEIAQKDFCWNITHLESLRSVTESMMRITQDFYDE